MAEYHRPDIAAWRAKSWSKEAYMWPLINLEHLTVTRNLLLLLHARRRHQPHEFVHSDLEQARLGEDVQVIRLRFLEEHTMLFHNRTTPKTYGKLVRDDDDKAFDNAKNWAGMHSGHGLQALEIQQRIWEFLVKICHLLLRDIASLADGDTLPDPGEPVSLHPEITSLRVMSMEAPYKVPAHIDYARIRALLFAERNAREDHIWSLREDPGYFTDVLQTFAAHHPLDPDLNKSDCTVFWNRVILCVIDTAYFGFAAFDEAVKQVDNVARLHAAHQHDIKPGDNLPDEMFSAFQHFRYLLNIAMDILLSQLRSGMFAPAQARRMCIQAQDPPPLQDQARNYMLLFFVLILSDVFLHKFGLHNFTDEIDRLTRINPECASWITPWTASRLSSLSVVSQCLYQLHLFQPWARRIEDDMAMNNGKMHQQYMDTFGESYSILSIEFEGSSIYKHADFSDGRFDYPIHHRRNRQNVETMIRAEKILDAFWAVVDQHYKTKSSSKSQHELFAHLLNSDRGIQRTAPWVEPEKTKSSPEKVKYVYQPLSSIFHDPTKQITGTFDRTSIDDASTKLKTRGTAAPPPVAPTPNTDTDASEPKKIFTVDKRAYKVFKALFHSPSNPDQPGEIPFVDFLHGMVSMGFTAEKLHGSAWSFVPTKLDVGVERSIQFHEPHPSNKIPFLWAKRFGRRLLRAYGWRGEMFRLK
ncbi:hypothetical protein NX059_001267 [Plenodomus lindquistii]|nr:hypothetical protein NX059_001267 [Plenodomus lindquistii]